MEPSKDTLHLLRGVIADSETLGLQRNAPIHEFAVYDMADKSLVEYIVDPYMVDLEAGDARQERTTNLASSKYDSYKKKSFNTWGEAIGAFKSQTQGGTSWLNKLLNADSGFAPHLHGKKSSPAEDARRLAALKAAGVSSARFGVQTDVTDLLLNVLPNHLAGRTVWFHNANFDSKVAGAAMGAAEAAGLENTLGAMLETRNPSNVDPFYVTGQEVQNARTMARVTGDWAPVWQAYKKGAPKAGEIAVRDSMDVFKAVLSMAESMDILQKGSIGGGSADIAYRLIGAATAESKKEAVEYLKFDEVHRAAEDTSKSQAKIVRTLVTWADALDKVKQGGDPGKYGAPLAQIARFGKGLAALQKPLALQAAASTVERATRAIETEGVDYQNVGVESIRWTEQTRPGADTGRVAIARAQAQRREFTDVDDVVEWMTGPDGRFSDQAVAVKKQHREYLETTSNFRTKTEAAEAFAFTTRNAAAKVIQNDPGAFFDQMQLDESPVTKIRSSRKHRRVAKNIAKGVQSLSGGGKYFALASGAATVLGGLGQLAGLRADSEDGNGSLASTSYQQWYNQREAMRGGQRPLEHDQNPVNYGFTHQGFSAASRRARTDFGSPYQGPVGSNLVFADQELLREREKFLRQQYGARHYDPDQGIFGIRGPFKDLLPSSGYTYMTDGTPVANGYQGIRGKGLMGLDLSSGKWKVEAEDADTIVVKRGGLRGALASFFGQNKEYSFRMAGIDSPETSHGAQSYHAPQPGAEASKAAFKALIQGSKNLELVYDPNQATYGRSMGVLVADGRNVNFDIVRQGIAAHLPFGDPRKSMLDYRALATMEAGAVKGQRGIWAEPWALSFLAANEASGNRMTFNSLARKDRIVQSVATMDMISLMEQAQDQGFYSNADAVSAAAVGKLLRTGKDNVQPLLTPERGSSYNDYTYELASDTRNFMKTRGSNRNPNRFSRSQGYGSLDAGMALDSMGSTNRVGNRSHTSFQKPYATKRTRQSLMSGQRQANKFMSSSAINHHQYQ